MDASRQMLTFGLQSEIFAIEADIVREILDLVPVTAVPNAPAFVGGLINVRGKVVPLADLRLKLGMTPTPPTIDTRIVVIEVTLAGEPTAIGVLADKVYEVTDIPPAAVEKTPAIGMPWRQDFIRFVGKRGGDFVIALDIETVFGESIPPLGGH